MRNVIAFIDRTESMVPVCDHASWAASKLRTPLELFHVVTQPDAAPRHHDEADAARPATTSNDPTATTPPPSFHVPNQNRQALEQAKMRAQAAGVQQVNIVGVPDEWLETLIESEISTRLYVIGHSGLDEKHATPTTLSPSVDTVVRTLHRPILVCHTSFKIPESFMVAVDGSESCRKAIQKLADSPLLRDMSCMVVHVGTHRDDLDWATERFEDAGFRVDSYLLPGDTVEALSHFIGRMQPDIFAIAAYGYTGLQPGRIGKITTAMLQATSMPLLLMR